MTYKFVTREDIENAFKHAALGEMRKIALRAIAQSDAYRKVARQYSTLPDKNIDAEAARLMERK